MQSKPFRQLCRVSDCFVPTCPPPPVSPGAHGRWDPRGDCSPEGFGVWKNLLWVLTPGWGAGRGWGWGVCLPRQTFAIRKNSGDPGLQAPPDKVPRRGHTGSRAARDRGAPGRPQRCFVVAAAFVLCLRALTGNAQNLLKGPRTGKLEGDCWGTLQHWENEFAPHGTARWPTPSTLMKGTWCLWGRSARGL